MDMLSNFQTIVEQSANTPSYNTCENLSEPHSSFDMFLTIIQTMTEGENLLSLDLENFPMTFIKVMLFKLVENAERAAQKTIQSLVGYTHCQNKYCENLGS